MKMDVNVSNHPFVKKFSDGDFFYTYDVNTNQIIEVDKPVYDIVDEFEYDNVEEFESRYRGIYEPSTIRKSIEEINNAMKHLGLFSNFRPMKVTLGIQSAEDVKKIHMEGLKQLVLELTKDCNLACRYCQTSGKYFDGNVTRLYMSEEICRKAINFFCERTSPGDQVFITFYGGEPLLRMELLKDALDYVQRRDDNKKYRFNLTTNGTLINKEFLDFAIKYDIFIMVSLDGPEIVNDRYRIFKNGRGTFKRIMKNLEFIKQYDNDFFSERVSISHVFCPPYDRIDDIIDFFSTNDHIKEISEKMRSSAVNTRGTSFFEDFQLTESFNDLKMVEDKFSSRLKKAVLEGDLSHLTIEKKKLYTIIYNLAKRPIKNLYEYVPPFGACHIGLRRLFVDVNGNFNICEKVINDYRIGCINSGFDYEQIAYYHRKFDEVMDDCKSCWAINHCERCWAVIGDIEKFTGNGKEEFCTMNKRIIEKAFKLYVQLLREDPDCLKVFGDVVAG